MTVLIVEDDQDFQELISKAFSSLKIKIKQVANGHQAIELISENNFDAVVLDMYLPGHNAVEIVNELKSFPDTIDLPVYLYSTHASQLTLPETQQLFAYDKTKVTPKQLAELVYKNHEGN